MDRERQIDEYWVIDGFVIDLGDVERKFNFNAKK